jgi:hypothetical protein
MDLCKGWTLGAFEMDFDPEFSAELPGKHGIGLHKIRVAMIWAAVAALLALPVTAGRFPTWLFPGPDPEPEGVRGSVSSVTSPPASAPQASPVESGRYHFIVNRDTGQCLDIPYGGMAPRTRVEQFPVNGGSNQLWRLEPVGGDGYRIINQHASQCLDIPYGTAEPHTPVEQFPVNGGANQGWRLIPVGDHWYRIVNHYTGQCLEVPSGSMERRTVIEQAPVNGQTNQHWRPIAVR